MKRQPKLDIYTLDDLTHSKRQRLKQLEGAFSDIKGARSEDKVESVLNFLVGVAFIESFKRHERHSDEDKIGKDFAVTMRGIELDLQVKSSISGVSTHKRRYPDIPVVCGNIPEDHLLKHIMTILNNAYNRGVN